MEFARVKSMILRNIFIKNRRWYDDLCEYYKVTPKQAEELGRRRPGRRPNLPASASTHAISNKTLEEIWQMRSRDSVADMHQFYKDMGAWATFRQCYYHCNLNAGHFIRGLRSGNSICEYGSGVAPITNWIVENVRNLQLNLAITDVESEHLAFAQWRLNKKITQNKLPFNLKVFTVKENKLPLEDYYDLILILEVFEHLYNPLEVANHLADHLKNGGRLYENYVICSPSGPNLQEAQIQREAVFKCFRSKLKLIKGPSPDKDAAGLRCWKKV